MQRYMNNTGNTKKGNEFLTLPETLEVVTTKTISVLTTDVKTRRLINVNKDTMEETQEPPNCTKGIR